MEWAGCQEADAIPPWQSVDKLICRTLRHRGETRYKQANGKGEGDAGVFGLMAVVMLAALSQPALAWLSIG